MCVRDVKGIGQYTDHLVPRLPHRVLDMVDRVTRRTVGDEQLAQSSGDVIDGAPREVLLCEEKVSMRRLCSFGKSIEIYVPRLGQAAP